MKVGKVVIDVLRLKNQHSYLKVMRELCSRATRSRDERES